VRAGETFLLPAPAGLAGMGVVLKVQGGRVVARDEDGRPALVIHRCGQGHSVLAAYPIEHMLASAPNSLEGQPAVGRLYGALKNLAGIRSPYRVAGASVELGCLLGEKHDYVVLVNHDGKPVSGTVVADRGRGQAFRIAPEGPEPEEGDSEGWPFTLPGFSGAVYEWRRR
jgi:hypothetical protein